MNSKALLQVTVFVSCLIISSALADYDGSVIYVDALNGDDSCIGWPSVKDPQYQDYGPKKTIMSAVQRAAFNAIIIVADGIYAGEDNINFANILEDKSLTLRSANGPENCIIDCGARTVPFQFLRPHQLEEPVAVMDGFTIVNARKAAVNFGNSSAAVIANCILSGNRVDPDFGVIFCRNYTTASIINCTIKNNTADSSAAAISCKNSAPTITDCSIVAPTTDTSQFAFGINSLNALPTITACTISRSTGIGIQLISDDDVNPEYAVPVKISNCTLTNNVQTAILLLADAEITNCLISGNSAQLGAGIFVGNPSHPYPYYDNEELDKIDVTISKCTITDNVADSAPALYCLDTNVNVNDCLIAGNYAASYDRKAGLEGASAILGYYGDFRITNSVITENYGEVYSGFALGFFDNPNVRIENSIISDNFAFNGSGGGLCFYGRSSYDPPYGSLTLENCEILRNSGRWDEVYGIYANGGAIRIANCLVLSEPDEQSVPVPIRVSTEISDDEHFCDIVNCTILRKGNWGSPCLIAQGPVDITNSILWADGFSGGSVISADLNKINVSYSNVQDPYLADVFGNGNKCQPPLFADSEVDPPIHIKTFGEDFHLKSQAGRYDPATESWVRDDVTSPGIDAGDPTMHVGAEPLSSGGRINMGAYGGTQYASKTAICTGSIVGDLNNDCTVNLTDFAIMAANWLRTTIQQQ